MVVSADRKVGDDSWESEGPSHLELSEEVESSYCM